MGIHENGWDFFAWNLEKLSERAVKYTAANLFLLQLSFVYNPSFYFNIGKKVRRHISFSSTCFCYYMKHNNNDNNNNNNNNNKICSLDLLVASNSTFMTYYMHLGTIQICQNLYKHYYYLISTTSWFDK